MGNGDPLMRGPLVVETRGIFTHLVPTAAIASLTLLGTIALLTGHDGPTLNVVLTLIGGLAGWHTWHTHARIPRDDDGQVH